jgi:tRNA-specific 2-thiouridylase
MNKKAVIAMSGGVDSSVAAALMLDEGYECIGVTLKLFDNDDIGAADDPAAACAALASAGHHGCCTLSDINDARDVAYRLNMPHYVLNFSEDFREQVIRRFIETYEAGATPNPCISCNRYIKFDRLLQRAKELAYDYIVTGHYAQIEKDSASGRFLLKKSFDDKKDQSYVLYAMTQEQLAHTRFPLGGMTKMQVRKIAEAKNFINAKKHDSQDICFVPDRDYGVFIEQYTGKTFPAGNIIDLKGKLLGKHRGLIRYTIGQRRGLGVACNEPVYVTAKSVKDNTVTLGPESALCSKSFTANDLNLISCASIEKPLRVKVKTRYLQQEQWATAEQTGDDELHVEFDEPLRAITPGQAAVLYDGDIVVGGGTIAGVG